MAFFMLVVYKTEVTSCDFYIEELHETLSKHCKPLHNLIDLNKKRRIVSAFKPYVV